MKLVAPIDVSGIISSYNVPASTNPAWSAATTYAQEARVVVGQYDYESIAGGNVGNDPTKDGGVKWLNLGPSNKWAMFNKKSGKTWLIGTSTTNPNTIDITFAPGRTINTVGLVGVVAHKVTVQMIVDGVTVYSKEMAVSTKTATDWYDYFYGDFVTRDSLAYTDLPAYAGAQIRVLVDNTGQTAEVGMMILGNQADIGWAIWGTQIGLENYSLSKTDDFGNITSTERGSRDTIDFDCRNYKDQVGNIKRILKPVKDTAAMYIGAEDVDGTIIVGKLENFNLTFANEALVEYSISVLGLN
ncbi:hypothetical protein ACIPL1_24670 [Pseudomonas sp. NPDC090202]|uniref:hypothetical protein n=1 Tax=Pseudomonas sp. NPDC090202 TaxID=3364476 RepID=UPI00380C33CF